MDKMSYGQNVLGDKISSGTKRPWDNASSGHNVLRDKMPPGTNYP